MEETQQEQVTHQTEEKLFTNGLIQVTLYHKLISLMIQQEIMNLELMLQY